jgi:serine/threonine-protein kinase RsbW
VSALAFKIRNDLNDLVALAGATTEFLESNGASPEVIFAANLTLEEMVSNTIKYAYGDGLEHQIEVQLLLGANALEIEIRDDGRPFDPCAHPEPSSSAVGDKREVGGLGIHFVRNILDSFNYVRRDGKNVVRVTKRF